MADYIERDKALDAVLQLPPKMDEQGYGWLGRRGVWQMLSNFPSADVAPVVHGKWKVSGLGDYYCTICQRSTNPRTNYCPHCGAKMDLLN